MGAAAVRTVELLVSHGADVNKRRPDGRTAHTLAALHGNDEVAAWLLRHGAKDELSRIDRFVGASEGSMSMPFQQSLSQRLVKGHGFLRRFRLADANDLTDDRTSNAKMVRGEVHVLPLQGEEFAAP